MGVNSAFAIAVSHFTDCTLKCVRFHYQLLKTASSALRTRFHLFLLMLYKFMLM